MGESAVMREVVDRPFKSPENVEVGRLGGERHGRGGERGLTIETGAPEDRAGQKMCDGFQRELCNIAPPESTGLGVRMQTGETSSERPKLPSTPPRQLFTQKVSRLFGLFHVHNDLPAKHD